MLTDSHIEKDALKKCEYLICEKIFRSLPDWFGIEESIVDYVDDIQIMETWTAKINGTMLGFITINQHNLYSAEIQVTALVNAAFIPVSIDIDDTGAAATLSRYRVGMTPITIITDPKGNVLQWKKEEWTKMNSLSGSE